MASVPYNDSSAASSRPKETFFESFGGRNTNTTPGSSDTLIQNYRSYTNGTFDRDFLAVRPSFGSGESFQLGFSFIKAKDEKSSIQYGNYPAENLVAGTDLLIAFDNQKVKWTTQVAFSLENTDISNGNLSDIQIDSVKGVFDTTKSAQAHQQAVQDANDLKNLAKIGSKFINDKRKFITSGSGKRFSLTCT